MSLAHKSYLLFRREMLVYMVSIVTGAIIARVLGPTVMGVYLILLMIPAYAEAFGRLKFDIAAVYFLGKDRHCLGEMTFVLNAVALICSVTIIILYCWKIDFFNAYLFRNAVIQNELLYLILLYVIFQFVGTNYSYLLIYLEDIRSYNFYLLIQQIIGPILAIIFLLVFDLGLLGMVFALVIAYALAVVYAAWKIQRVEKMIPNFNLQMIKDLFKFSYNLYLSGIVCHLNTYVSSLFVAFYLLPAQVAFFRMGQDKAKLLHKIPTAIGTILYPRISKMEDSSEQNANLTALSYRISLILMSFSAIIGVLLIRPAVFVLYGKDFLPLSTSFWIFIPGVVLSGATSVFNQYFIGIGRPKFSLYISIIPLIFQIVLGYILIPVYGVVGAAFTTSLTFIGVSLITILVFNKISKVSISQIMLPHKSDFVIISDFIKSQLHSIKPSYNKGEKTCP